MTYEAVLLRQMVETRIAVSESYRIHIAELLDIPNVPIEVIEKIQDERERVITKLTQKIDDLRQKIAQ